MFWLYSLFGAVVFGALMTLLLARVFGRDEVYPPRIDSPEAVHPWADTMTAPISADGVGRAKFALALRGYDQRQVDEYLRRVQARLAELEGTEPEGIEPEDTVLNGAVQARLATPEGTESDQTELDVKKG